MHRNLNIKIREPAPGLLTATKVGDQPPSNWRGPYPNLADNFSFAYWQLLNLSYENGTPLASGSTKRVAVIGAGIAGTEVARELARAGYNVDLYEASNRIGGRTNSFRAPDGAGGAQLTCYEQGAMRIPFFNRGNPKKAGPGPYVGGPFVSDTASAQSCAEFWANKYAISTAAFPDPGKAPGPEISPGVPSFPGVATGIFVNQGFGVDLASLYPDGAGKIPKTPFIYNWPDTSADIPSWPTSDPYLTYMPVFYNRGQQMNVPAIPNITLGHAIPNDGPNIPPTFVPSDPNYAANVAGWRLGVNALRTVAYKWSLFASAFLYTIGGINYEFDVDGQAVKKDASVGDWSQALYNSNNWENFWINSVMPRYQNVNFYEVAMAGPILPVKQADGSWHAPAEWLQGNFGGLGCSAAEAQVFYTIGAGDGSWGAFFPNSALWALRALLFGFATQHQLILGCLNESQTGVTTSIFPPADQTPQGGNRTTLQDSLGNEYWAPQYTGVNCFSECHFFTKMRTDGCVTKSFYDLVREGAAHFYSSTKVTGINKIGFEALEVSATNLATGAPLKSTYNYVVLTVPIWNTQTDMTITGFDVATQLPIVVSNALDTSHWIRSCKVFVALKQPYWQQGPNDPRIGKMQFIPQVLATNTELQDMYGLNGPTGTDPWPITGGIALISYTWEDDAQKFLSFQEKDLVVSLLDRLERLLLASGLPSFKQFMQDPTLAAPGSYTVWRWSLVPTAHGCAKAYQEGIENLNYSLLTYNKVYSAQSQIYFAGDAYSLESGWLEPALRMGLDVVLNLANNDSSATVTTVGGFNFKSDYLSSNPMSTTQAQRTWQLGPVSSGGGLGSGNGGNGGKPADDGNKGGGCCTTS